MTIGESQPSAHAVGVNCDWGTGTRVRIPQPVHGKDPERKNAGFFIPFSLFFNCFSWVACNNQGWYNLPEGVGVGGKVGKDIGVAKSVSAGGPGVLLRVLLLQLVVLDRAATVLLRRLPEQSHVTVLD